MTDQRSPLAHVRAVRAEKAAKAAAEQERRAAEYRARRARMDAELGLIRFTKEKADEDAP